MLFCVWPLVCVVIGRTLFESKISVKGTLFGLKAAGIA